MATASSAQEGGLQPPSKRQRAEERLSGLRWERGQWWPHWSEVAAYILPRRFRWLSTPNQSRGGPINQHIYDSTGTIAFRTLAAGMMSGITSPTRPWFKLRVGGFDQTVETQAAAIWCDEVVSRMMAVFHSSNFYSAMATKYADLSVFGTSAMLIYQDYENVINCVNPCLGEFFFGLDDRGAVVTFAREFTMTAAQIEARWPDTARKVQAIRTCLETRGASLAQEFQVRHLIEPNKVSPWPEARGRAYREIYWPSAGNTEDVFEIRGFHELPFLAGRWDLAGNDAYGRSPAMDALPDIKQLQHMTKRKAQAIDKMVNPPLVGDSRLKNQPATALPGGITYYDAMSTQTPGLRPLYQVQPDIQAMMLDMKEIQERIKVTAFNDLFMMISNLQTVRSATEIDARREEKLIMMGPVLERFQNEVLDPAVNRTFQIMLRGGLLPEPPAELQGQHIHVDYVSMLAEAQRATATAGIERVLQIAGNMAAADPSVMDTLDLDESLREYANLLGVPARILKDPQVVAQLRQQRAEAQQQQALLEQTTAGAMGAKTLSQADLGGGQNALQAMLGTGPQGTMQ